MNWRTTSLACGAAMFLCMALGRFSFSTMIPALIESGAITTVQGGYIGGVNLCGFFAGAIAAVRLARFYRAQHTILFSVYGATLALFACIVPAGIYWLGFWRFFIGVCTGLVMVQSLTLAITLAPSEKRAQAAAFVFTGVGAGIFFSGSAVPLLLRYSIPAAWTGVAVAGLLAALFVTATLQHPSSPTELADNSPAPPPPRSPAWYLLVAASAWFSFGIVPHTLYWFDFIARDLGQGDAIAGYHWMVIGIAGIIGPLAAARLAAEYGAPAATVTGFSVLAFGVGLPVFNQHAEALWMSTLLFGLQPGVSGLIATRVRELGTAAQVLTMMRVVILANGVGAATGGLAYPFLFARYGDYSVVFLSGGIGFLVGAACCFVAQKP